MVSADVWWRFDHDPRRAENAALRASDRDREIVTEVLGDAFAQGRLTPVDLDDRTTRVTESTTLGQLPEIIADLVPAQGPALSALERMTPETRRLEAESRYRNERTHALRTFLVPSLICVAIWIWPLLSGGVSALSFPWPLFVILGTGGRFFYLSARYSDRVAQIERDLEAKQNRALEKRAKRELGRPDDTDTTT